MDRILLPVLLYLQPGAQNYKRQKIDRRIFLTGRLLALSAALILITYSLSWASDGSWDDSTGMFISGMICFIPFNLFGRKIKSIKKSKKYSKRKSAIIGWRYSGRMMCRQKYPVSGNSSHRKAG